MLASPVAGPATVLDISYPTPPEKKLSVAEGIADMWNFEFGVLEL